MSNFHFIGRQPVIDAQRRIFAYDLFFRDDRYISDKTSGIYATTSVLTNVLNRFGRREILGNYKAFVRVDEDFLLNDLTYTLPKDIFIFSVMPSLSLSDQILYKIRELYREGFQIALNDMALNQEILERIAPLIPYCHYIKVDVERTPKEQIPIVIDQIKQYDIDVIASKVATPQMAQLCEDVGCSKLQGYFFSKPTVLKTESLDPHYHSVIQAYNMLISNVDIDEIAAFLEQNSVLALQLLRYINSAAVSLPRAVSSIHEVIVLLGRRNVSQWLLMMVYSRSLTGEKVPHTLALVAKNRMDLMAKMWQLIHPEAPKSECDEAYFIGAISLLDVVMQIPLAHILEAFHVSSDVKEALLQHRGKFGQLFLFIKAIEACDDRAIDRFLHQYGIDKHDYEKILYETAVAVNRFDEDLESIA